VSGTTLTLAGATCSSPGTGGNVFKNSYPGNISFAREVVLTHIGNDGNADRIHRIGDTLGVIYDNTTSGADLYYERMCNLSDSLQYVVCTSNFGIPDAGHVTLMSTGISAAPGGISIGSPTGIAPGGIR
jgi:hypothetical protein